MKIDLPGIVYSLLLAVGAWAVEYFTSGPGSGIPWAPILLATIPLLLKTFTVQVEDKPMMTESGTRSMQPVKPQRSKVEKWLLG